MSILDKLAPTRINRKIIFWLIFLIIVIAYVAPIGLPVPISQNTQKAYDFIQNLPAGSVILYSLDWSSGGIPELEPSAYPTMQHLMVKNLKVIIVAFAFPEDTIFMEHTVAQAIKQGNIPATKKYGVDYVMLGYIPGGEPSMTAMASDFKRLVRTDVYGTPISQIPMLQNIRDYHDIAAIVFFDDVRSSEMFVRQWYAPYKIPLIAIPTGANVVGVVPYYAAGQLVGYLPTLRGGAEYEKLMNLKGIATASMDMISLTMLTLVVLAIVGNIYEISTKMKGKR